MNREDKILFSAIGCLILLTFSILAIGDRYMTPENLSETVCIKESQRKEQVCNNSARGGAIAGAIVGHVLFDSATAGAVIGGSGGTTRCHEETVKICDQHETRTKPNPSYGKWFWQ